MRREPSPNPAWGRLLLLALFGLSLAAMSCHADGGCLSGQRCECYGGPDCYLGCSDDDGCVQLCHGVASQCGAVCGNHCQYECFDTNECSSSCGDNCSFDCHNVVACGAFCGAGCDIRCTSGQRCGVQVGPSSSVECTSITSCQVECLGTCQVACAGVGTCDVNCLDARNPLNSCGNGVYSCGPC